MLKTALRPIALSVLVGALTACGEGGDTANSGSAGGISGRVADGYLKGATVCLDKNLNGQCESDEPQATTGEGGKYTLTGISQADLNKYPIVADVPATAIDEDTGQQVGKPYILSAPPGKPEFVSPVTTLIAAKVMANPTVTLKQVELEVKNQLGGNLDPYADYVEKEKTDAEYGKLHKTAQAVATLMADVLSNNTGAQVSEGALVAAIAEATVEKLSQIKGAFDADADQDPEAVAQQHASEVATEAQKTAADKEAAIELAKKGRQTMSFADYLGSLSGPVTFKFLTRYPVGENYNGSGLPPLYIENMRLDPNAKTLTFWACAPGEAANVGASCSSDDMPHQPPYDSRYETTPVVKQLQQVANGVYQFNMDDFTLQIESVVVTTLDPAQVQSVRGGAIDPLMAADGLTIPITQTAHMYAFTGTNKASADLPTPASMEAIVSAGQAPQGWRTTSSNNLNLPDANSPLTLETNTQEAFFYDKSSGTWKVCTNVGGTGFGSNSQPPRCETDAQGNPVVKYAVPAYAAMDEVNQDWVYMNSPEDKEMVTAFVRVGGQVYKKDFIWHDYAFTKKTFDKSLLDQARSVIPTFCQPYWNSNQNQDTPEICK